jgi:hypothetical protein
MIKHILNIIKGWFAPKLKLEVEVITKNFCDEHNKYKHRCPKCRELAGVV